MGCVYSSLSLDTMFLAAKEGDVLEIERVAKAVPCSEARGEMLEWIDELGRTPLIISIEYGHHEASFTLLNLGSDMHHLSSRGSVLLTALRAENWLLLDVLLEGGNSQVGVLDYQSIDLGANPFVKTLKGLNAYEYAQLNCRNSGLLREFEKCSGLSGYVTFQVSSQNQECQNAFYSWKKLWAAVVPDCIVDNGQVYMRKMLYVYSDFKAVKPLCIAELDGVKTNVVEKDKNGTVISLTLSILPYELKEIVGIGGLDSCTLFVRQSRKQDSFLFQFLNVCQDDWDFLGFKEDVYLFGIPNTHGGIV